MANYDSILIFIINIFLLLLFIILLKIFVMEANKISRRIILQSSGVGVFVSLLGMIIVSALIMYFSMHHFGLTHQKMVAINRPVQFLFITATYLGSAGVFGLIFGYLLRNDLNRKLIVISSLLVALVFLLIKIEF